MKIKFYFSLILLSTFFSICEKINAQSPDWLWAKGMGGTNHDYGNSMVVDASGNVYTAGSFSDTVDFDPGAGVFNLISGGGAGIVNIFISKLDSLGNFVWAKRMGGVGGAGCTSIARDASGNLYTTGLFSGTAADFDPGSGTFNLTSVGGRTIFISKLDSSGNFVWARAMNGNGTGPFNSGLSIALDTLDNVYTTGYFSGTVDFDPGSSGNFNLTSAGNYDIFISKLDSAGNFIWAKAIGGTGYDVGFSLIPYASGNVYTTGYFEGTVDFDPGAGTYYLTSAGWENIFVSKLDSSGNFIWAKQMGGTGSDAGNSIAVDASGNIYTIGLFQGTADFDPDSSGNFNLTSSGDSDIFISKLDATGNFVWAKAMGGTGLDIGASIALDASGNIYTTGFFTGTADFDPASAGNFNLISSGGRETFISKLNGTGNFVWAKQMGGIGDDYASCIAIDASGNVHVTGYFFSPSIAFGSTVLTNVDNTGATSDIFIAKLDTTLVTGNNDISSSLNITSIYPNPVSNHFTIAWAGNNKKVEVTITDITGKIIYTTTASEKQKIEVNIKGFSEGVYLVRIQAVDFIETKKLIVTK